MSRYRKRGLFTTLLVVALLSVSGLAAAAPASQHPADAEEDLAPIGFEYLEDEHLLVYWLTGDEPAQGDPVDCTEGFGENPVDEEAVTEADVAAEVELPEGCHSVDVAGPNGQINHGTIMSAFVHSLKDVEFAGPRGQAVRELAHSDLGKGDQQIKTGDHSDVDDNGDDEDDTEIDDSEERSGPPDHANANGRDKKPKKPKK